MIKKKKMKPLLGFVSGVGTWPAPKVGDQNETRVLISG